MWLKWVIRSDVSHLAKSAANRAEVRLDPASENGSSTGGSDIERRQPSPQRLLIGSPEEVVIDAETEADKTCRARSKIDALLEACSGQPELEEIVYAIVESQCDAKPQKLSEFLGRPVEEIYQNCGRCVAGQTKIRMEARNGRG